MIAKGYSQQKALDADAKEIQQINFDLNLNQTWNKEGFPLLKQLLF